MVDTSRETVDAVVKFFGASAKDYLKEIDSYGTIEYFMFKEAENIIWNSVDRCVKHSKGNKLTVLDAGCGNGRWSAVYAKKGFDVIGIDLARNMLKAASKRAKMLQYNDRLDLVNADLMSLPVSDNSVDIIHLYGVIEHIPVKLLKTLVTEMVRILRTSGVLIMDVAQKGSMSHCLFSFAMQLKQSRVPFYHFFGENETRDLIAQTNYSGMALMEKLPGHYWWSGGKMNKLFRSIFLTLGTRNLNRLSKIIFRKPCGLILVMRKSHRY
jgi:ubiquinone/menaquinone biosynthesis C-methylase UbiE